MSLMINKNYDEVSKTWKIQLDGEVDIYTAGKLKETFIKMLEEKKESIKIDAGKLEYIDSTGLGVLIGVLKKLKEENKNIIFLNIKPNIKKLLNITGLDKIFIIEG
ncbi:anti-sigma B factor antagonist [Natronincola peptidivorans]|uniref:Anti-sigma factor antagonist n=1 Tax=Natronincola peptidivorans TaxID=426128 RepID=A0A1I0GQC1_9FIRM|nr:STAS domain-containing protein [Natronincola peptidivorans]SET72364.1 anti-sigma B factor antagonist [Natronincola peptidivorans]